MNGQQNILVTPMRDEITLMFIGEVTTSTVSLTQLIAITAS